MKVDVNKTEGFTCRAAGEVGLDGGSLVDDNRKTVDSVGSGGGAIGERGGYSGVDQSDDSTSSRVSGREMHRVGCENLLKRGEVVVRRSTNILGTDNIISLKQRLKM
jgi:hypothetical protein